MQQTPTPEPGRAQKGRPAATPSPAVHTVAQSAPQASTSPGFEAEAIVYLVTLRDSLITEGYARDGYRIRVLDELLALARREGLL